MKTLWGFAIGAAWILVTGCAGPAPIKPGSPAFFWAVANESYRTGDLLKADATLVELSAGDHEYAARAQIWQMVVSAGISRGLWELADAYQSGSEVNPAGFRAEASRLRSMAANTALEFTQALRNSCEIQEVSVPLAFGFPPGFAERPPALAQIAAGKWLADTGREALERAMLERGVILAASAAVGKPGDPVHAMTAFGAAPVAVPRQTFFYQMANLLFEQSGLFDAQHIDRPDRQAVMYQVALAALRAIEQSDDAEALATRIHDALNKLPRS
ncbi:MAG TPA: hypothetical protein VKT49_11780 [Bryobacteraceae bacterium]|nr:hypothetical protein [Bryobacteraceae bacterium]